MSVASFVSSRRRYGPSLTRTMESLVDSRKRNERDAAGERGARARARAFFSAARVSITPRPFTPTRNIAQRTRRRALARSQFFSPPSLLPLSGILSVTDRRFPLDHSGINYSHLFHVAAPLRRGLVVTSTSSTNGRDERSLPDPPSGIPLQIRRFKRIRSREIREPRIGVRLGERRKPERVESGGFPTGEKLIPPRR